MGIRAAGAAMPIRMEFVLTRPGQEPMTWVLETRRCEDCGKDTLQVLGPKLDECLLCDGEVCGVKWADEHPKQVKYNGWPLQAELPRFGDTVTLPAGRTVFAGVTTGEPVVILYSHVRGEQIGSLRESATMDGLILRVEGEESDGWECVKTEYGRWRVQRCGRR